MHSLPGYHDKVASSYAKQEIEGSDPLGLVARLYELAIVEVARTRTALAAGNWAAKGASVRRIGEYLSLLQCSLSFEGGGDVAVNLDRIYTYLLVRLSEGHIGNQDAVFAEIGQHLTELGSAWRQAASQEVAAPAEAEPALDTAAAGR